MKSVLLAFFVCVLSVSMAQETTEVSDSLYKIKRVDFEQKYVTDDTTAALIKMFYRKRKTAKLQLLVIPATLIGGYIAQATYNDPFGPGKEKARNDVLTWGGVISLGVGIESYMKMRTYTRKELYLALKRYAAGEGILDEHYFEFKASDFPEE